MKNSSHIRVSIHPFPRSYLSFTPKTTQMHSHSRKMQKLFVGKRTILQSARPRAIITFKKNFLFILLESCLKPQQCEFHVILFSLPLCRSNEETKSQFPPPVRGSGLIRQLCRLVPMGYRSKGRIWRSLATEAASEYMWIYKRNSQMPIVKGESFGEIRKPQNNLKIPEKFYACTASMSR